MRFAFLGAAVLGLVAGMTDQTGAATIVQFSYSGHGVPGFEGIDCNGNGSFSFADGLSTVGLTDLSSFTVTLDENTPNTVTFGLADLKDFSATLARARR